LKGFLHKIEVEPPGFYFEINVRDIDPILDKTLFLEPHEYEYLYCGA
jgi:hypothetical protein